MKFGSRKPTPRTADAADVFKQNNPWKRADFGVKAPGMDWDAYFTAAGVAGQSEFIVWQPSAVTGTSALVGSEGIDLWKDYLRFHLIEHYASVLPKAVAAEDFAFYGTILSGMQQTPDRSKDAIAATNAALGQAVGQLYTQRYFPPEAKARAQAMVGDLITAYRVRISNLTWMSPQTKEKALAKLAALRIGIGYPDTWIDYSTLDVSARRRIREYAPGGSLQSFAQSGQAETDRPIRTSGGSIRKSSARSSCSPPIPKLSRLASCSHPTSTSRATPPLTTALPAPASPTKSATASTNSGNIYDAQGRLGNWWTPEDLAKYHAAAAKLVAQFDGYCPLADLCVNGKQVLSENIADLAGLLTAHDAYVLSLKGKTDIVINGLTGEQRFFLAFAQRWRKAQSEAALRRQIKTDTHSPGEYRSDTVRNVEAWYKAYEIAPGDKLYLKPEDRVGIW